MEMLRGNEVDRPPVNFYEVGGFCVDPADPDPFNIYNDPSWTPLLEMAEERTDLIRMMNPVRQKSHQAWESAGRGMYHSDQQVRVEEEIRGKRKFIRTIFKTGNGELTSVQCRETDADTAWTIEPLLKDVRDVDTFLELPDEMFEEHVDVAPLLQEEKQLDDRGIVMVDTEDPLCAAATLFTLEEYAIFALQEQKRFHLLLEKCARYLYRRVEAVCRLFPGRLWRIYGAEFAASPYLPPRLFREYVVRYTRPMIDMIHAGGGFVRLHCHGRVRAVLDMIIEMGSDAIDPVEAPPQGDCELRDVRRRYGRELVIFGNLQASDLESMEQGVFRKKVEQTLAAGTEGTGRGFVLMPTAAPFQRKLPARAIRNFETMLDVVASFGG